MWEETSDSRSAYVHVAGRTGLLSSDEMPDIWSKLASHVRAPLRCHAAVLMSSHFHILISGPEPLEKRLEPLTSNFCDCQMQKVRSGYQYLVTYEYIYRNPVEAGLAHDVLDYPYSTLPALFFGGDFQAIDDVSAILTGPRIVAWLNRKAELPAHLSSHIERRMRRL